MEISEEAAFGYTLASGRLFMPFDKFHEYCEKLKGRPIFTHEFASRQFWDEMKKRFEELAIEKFEKGVASFATH